MLRNLIAACASLAALVVAVPCDAQIVRFGGFGGVRIRAPFVAVDVGPYGGTRVRAPFTSVYSYGPGYPYGRSVVGVPVAPPIPPFGFVPAYPAYPPVYPVPELPDVVYQEPAIAPEGYQVTRPSIDGHVSEDLRAAAIRLQQNLSQRHDANIWLDYLNPARIVTSIDQGDAPSTLRDLVANYNGVVANGSLRAIYSISGFNKTRELLGVYVDMQPTPRAPRAVEPRPAPPPANPVVPPTDDAEELPAPDRDPAPIRDPAPDRDVKLPVPPPPPPQPHPPGANATEPTEI